MRYVERKEFQYDPAVFKAKDAQTALRIHREATRAHSPKPPPVFLEVDRRSANIDALWHVPLTDRTTFSRQIPMPCINTFVKPDWRLTKMGIVPQRQDKFALSHLLLKEADYFPMRGDMVAWNSYRYMILNVELAPEGYWQQTNIWMGLVCTCIIPPDGDARPLLNLAQPAPSEWVAVRPEA